MMSQERVENDPRFPRGASALTVSLIAHAAHQGIDVAVVCATRGEGGSPAPGSTITAGRSLADVRESELRAAAQLLGASAVHLLGWIDSGMDGEPAAGTLCAAPLDDVAGRVAAAIDDLRPHIVVTLDGSDGHRDHIHLRDATLAAVEEGLKASTNRNYRIVPDRREAIRRAVSVAMGGGWSVLVAGKGHENAQIVGNQRLPFSDRDEIERAVVEHRASEAGG